MATSVSSLLARSGDRRCPRSTSGNSLEEQERVEGASSGWKKGSPPDALQGRASAAGAQLQGHDSRTVVWRVATQTSSEKSFLLALFMASKPYTIENL